MSESKHREIHAIMRNGERVYLGSEDCTDEEVREFYNAAREAYDEDKISSLKLRHGVYDVTAFAGIQITPPPAPQTEGV